MSQILVACERLNLAGGLFRFERVGRSLRSLNVDLSWLAFDQGPHQRPTEFSILSLQEAFDRDWLATMVPGAGFRDETIKKLGRLTGPQFGTRVQHLLDDHSRRDRFLIVNKSFQPHVVISNNRHWTA